MDIGGAVVIKGTQDPFSPKTMRASSGAAMRLPLLPAESARDALDVLKRHGKRCVAAAMKGTVSSFLCDLSKDCAIIIGNEGGGVSAELLDGADETVYIPMTGRTESLNAALAGGMLMYEAMRQAAAGRG
jgi:TrmH family RNA methyltransferase